MARLYTILGLLLISYTVFSQKETGKNIKKLEKTAYNYIANEEYKKAIPLYEELVKAEPENEEYTFYYGISNLGAANENEALNEFNSIIKKYEASKSETPFTRPSYYYSGLAYHNLYLFDQAIESFKKLEQFELNDKGKTELAEAIKKTEEAQKLFNEFKPLVVTRLAILNSPFDDHTPIPNADATKIFFTSKREGSMGEKANDDDGYYEDIWVWDRNKGLLSKPHNISEPINTTAHEATCGLSADGNILFIYKSDKKSAGDIYVSRKRDTLWTAPTKMTKKINKRSSIERHAALSPDGKKLYFSSDRKRGGKGGRDIWISELQKDSTWSKPKLAEGINTKEDEESPFILPDGRTMYFSSKGFYGMGGYDVFKCTINSDGTFSEPVNIGFPINTVADDVFYFPLADEKTAYFTRRRGGYADIFKANLYGPDDDIIILAGLIKDNKEYSDLYGVEKTSNDTVYYDNRYMVSYDHDKPTYKLSEDSVLLSKYEVASNEVADTVYFVPDDEIINIFNLELDEQTEVYTTNSLKGDYNFLLLAGKDFKIHYDAPGHVFDSYDVSGSDMTGQNNINYEARLVKIEQGETEKSKLTTFDANSSDFNDFTQKELDLISQSLLNNPELVVNFSTEDYLKPSDNLSENRKQRAIDYLTDQGIAKDRIYVDLSPRDIPSDNLEYTIFDTESVKKAIEDKENRKKENEITEPTETDYIVQIANVYFEFNKFELKVKPNAGLDKLAEYMKRNSSARIEILGYTDAVGSDSYNAKLSDKRAKTVKAYLTGKGISEDQISYKGYGESNPITQNTKAGKWFEDSKKYNRRVEFRISKQGQPTLIIKQLEDIPEEHKNPKYNPNYSGK